MDEEWDGEIDILVNNAGLITKLAAEDEDENVSSWLETIQVADGCLMVDCMLSLVVESGSNNLQTHDNRGLSISPLTLFLLIGVL